MARRPSVPIQCTSGLWAGAGSWQEENVRGSPWESESKLREEATQPVSKGQRPGKGKAGPYQAEGKEKAQGGLPQPSASLSSSGGHGGDRQSQQPARRKKSTCQVSDSNAAGTPSPPAPSPYPNLELRSEREEIYP